MIQLLSEIPLIAYQFIAWMIVSAWFEWHVPPYAKFSDSFLLGGIVVLLSDVLIFFVWALNQIPPQ
jgi:hypothetical protein